ncbi:MAG: hypothetical protein LC772_05805, partial [Chloroflexi bacterium]|nr:hypothetical protein [Chloroflexota bacterium]
FEKWARNYNIDGHSQGPPRLVAWTHRPLQTTTLDGQAIYSDATRIDVPLVIVPAKEGFWIPESAVTHAAVSASSWNGAGMEAALKPGADIRALQLPASAGSIPGCALDLRFMLSGDSTRQATIDVWQSGKRRWVSLVKARVTPNALIGVRLKDLRHYLDPPPGPAGADPWITLYLRISGGSQGGSDALSASLLGPGCSWPRTAERMGSDMRVIQYPGPSSEGRP